MKKKFFIVSLFLIPFFSFSQTIKPIDGFLGIKFGSSRAAVAAALKAKGGQFNKKGTDADNLAFFDVKLSNRTANEVIVTFINDKAYDATLYFEPQVEAKVVDEYNTLVGDISRVYGDGMVTATYNDPYTKDEGISDTLTGLHVGKIDLSTKWYDANKNAAQARISTDMSVELEYQSYTLNQLAEKKVNNKQKSEF